MTPTPTTRSLIVAAAAATVMTAAGCGHDARTEPSSAPAAEQKASTAWKAAPAIYRAAITTALRSHGCPGVGRDLIAAEIMASSDFDHTAVSPVGALGPAQIPPSMWDRYAPGVGATDPHNILDAATVQVAINCADAAKLTDLGHTPTTELLARAYVGGVDNAVSSQQAVIARIDESGAARVLQLAQPQ